jgi:Fe-S cluster biogenesis protein NfuA
VNKEQGEIMIARIKEIIEAQIRPSLKAHGGDIELVAVEDGIVKVKLRGACSGCPSSAITLYHGVQQILMESMPDVKGVEQVW